MHPKLAILSVFFITCNGLSIEKVSENYKSVTITGDAFKDNYDSDEFVKHGAMAAKKRIKKRLALPMNYKLSAFEEIDDYFDKGGGDSDNNEGNYESKDWSDLNREPINIKNPKTVLQNHDLTNIEGIDVIKKQSEDFQSPKHIVKNEVVQKSFASDEDDEKQDGNPLIAIHTTDKGNVSTKTTKNSDEFNDYYDIHKTNEKVIHNTEKSIEDKLKKPKDQDISYYDEPTKQDENPQTKIREVLTTTERIQAKRRKTKTNDDVDDYYDSADKIRSDAIQAKEDRENEAKKLKILESVDDLKERHALESKLISEKFKEEELHREEFERNNLRSYPRNLDKYRQSSHHKPRGKVMNDYEEYEERPNFRDKYKPEQVTKTTVKSITTTATKGKPNENRKISVFKSPQLYVAYDDAYETTEHITKKVAKPFTVEDSTDERISLIPEDAKEGEPTLFMPKKFYKNKKQKKNNNFPEEYITESKYSPNNNIKATTLAMITDNYFPTTDISLATEPSYSTEVSPEHEQRELRSKPMEYKYAINADLQPQRTTETDHYTEKIIGDNDFTEKNTGDSNITENTNGDITNTEKNIGDSGYTEKNIGDSDITETNNGDREVDMSGVGSDLNSITTNENFDENSTADAKYYIEPEISLARQEETTEFSSDGSEGLTRSTTIIQTHEDLAPQSSDHLSDDYHNGKERGGGRRHGSEHEQEHKEKGEKNYESENEQEIIAKGFHDVRKDINKYDSHDQAKEVYADDSGHSASHDHVESGKKHAEYEETGKHSKGHSTKGSHDVHKKEEYEKKEEFFDYSGEEEDKGKKRADSYRDSEHRSFHSSLSDFELEDQPYQPEQYVEASSCELKASKSLRKQRLRCSSAKKAKHQKQHQREMDPPPRISSSNE